MGEYKKISGVELVIWVVFLLGLYTLNDLLDGVLIGLIIVPVINFALTTGSQLFFKGKGDPGAGRLGQWLIQMACDIIPFVPAPVFAFVIKAIKHNRLQPSAAVEPAYE